MENSSPESASSKPAFNLEKPIIILIITFIIVHLYKEYGLSNQDQYFEFLIRWAFFPLRYTSHVQDEILFPMGTLGAVITFFTHGLLHGDWLHLGMNTMWLMAFGQSVAARLQAKAFIALFFICVGAGALTHLAFNIKDVIPLVGASGGVAGMLGAASRFAFQPSKLEKGHTDHDNDLKSPENSFQLQQKPLLSLKEALTNRTVLVLMMSFFAINFLTGLGVFDTLEGTGSIAWQAHIGGFVMGFLMFPFFDGRSKKMT